MTELLRGAFTALGPGPTRGELAYVVETLQRSGDRETLAVLDAAAAGDDDALKRLHAIAERAGSLAVLGLDMAVVHAGGIQALTPVRQN